MIILSGASKGIGEYLTDFFIKEGQEVIGLYNSTTPSNHKKYYQKLNITDEESIANFVSCNSKILNDIVLINCAGINFNSITIKFDFSEWKKVFEVNTHGTFLLIKHLLPFMREQTYGRIINFSSVVPQIGMQGTVAYAGSKSALWGMTKVIANENATKGITVNTLNLGYFDIGMIREVPEGILNSIIDTIPVKKLELNQ